MAFVARIMIYLGACGAAVGAAAVAFLMLMFAGLEALPTNSATHASPRIAAWLERQAVPFPELPSAHGPALTDQELAALAARNASEPIVRVPIMAMTEDDRAPAATARSRPMRATPRPAEDSRVPDAPGGRAYRPTARELYAPERND